MPRDEQSSRLRHHLARQAARLLFEHRQADPAAARRAALTQAGQPQLPRSEQPRLAEIRAQLQQLTLRHALAASPAPLAPLRLTLARVASALAPFAPHVVGSSLVGFLQRGSQVELFATAAGTAEVLRALASAGLDAHTLPPTPDSPAASFSTSATPAAESHAAPLARFALHSNLPLLLTLYPRRAAARLRRQARALGPFDYMPLAELFQQLDDTPATDLAGETDPARPAPTPAAQQHTPTDRFQVYASLLWPLEEVRQDPRRHPEGDALYHSLQVFELARELLPYDEEFLLAALLHDVGKAVEPRDAVASSIALLADWLTPRALWLIEHHQHAHDLLEGTLGNRFRRRLQEHDSYEELLLLAQCDRRGRRCGAPAPTVDQALAYLRDLAQDCDDTPP